ncbi:hypothetical protein PRIPAC_70440 [Pristionchus pacificus]|uniref:aECM cysteine-cradle domain-containing protein n=1 Tax=Pristionchus pacificus TaxID=54126 RepID=A0A2A6CFC1_PRIPA|nr:hypothetical protein PRIPAC_70440 [Pristionchus pacificus]|eukprot:PDM76701.1 hypothetical protein PRIPAC_42096 [Pristionchus pacificus]
MIRDSDDDEERQKSSGNWPLAAHSQLWDGVGMRSTTLLALAVLVAVAASRKNTLKTKKYKCIEVIQDEDTQNFGGWSKSDEELRPIGSARLGHPDSAPSFPPPPHSSPRPQFQMEKPRSQIEEYTSAPKTPSAFISPMQAPRDSHGNPLVLSPQHCNQVKHYAGMYGVRDVLTWVKSNCAFAKMYLPSATCEEINVLIASCYPKQPTVAAATPRPRLTTTAASPAASNTLTGMFGTDTQAGGQSLLGNWKPWFW